MQGEISVIRAPSTRVHRPNVQKQCIWIYQPSSLVATYSTTRTFVGSGNTFGKNIEHGQHFPQTSARGTFPLVGRIWLAVLTIEQMT